MYFLLSSTFFNGLITFLEVHLGERCEWGFAQNQGYFPSLAEDDVSQLESKAGKDAWVIVSKASKTNLWRKKKNTSLEMLTT